MKKEKILEALGEFNSVPLSSGDEWTLSSKIFVRRGGSWTEIGFSKMEENYSYAEFSCCWDDSRKEEVEGRFVYPVDLYLKK